MFERHYAHWPPGLAHTLEVPRTTIYTNLAQRAAQHPDKTAIDYYGTRISYGELMREADALAGFLQSRCGVRKGDRVLLDLQNSPQSVIAYYGVLRADAVVVPVNPMNRREELRHYVDDSQASVAIVGQEVYDQIEGLEGLRHTIVVTYSDYLREPTNLPIPPFVRAPTIVHSAIAWKAAVQAKLAPGAHTAGPDDLAAMPYTSGTTGKPKGCMHTHSSIQATTVPYMHWRGVTGEDVVVLSALPMFHVTGMQAGMNAPLYLGATIVLLSRWDRDCAGMQIERAKVTNWSAITTMLVDFLSNPNLGKYDLSSLRVLGGGGAAMPEALARKLEEVFHLPYIEGYGLSETMAPTHMNPPHRPKRQCGGIPIFNTDARVLDVETGRELGPNEVGEIVVHGPQVFKGYWRQEAATRQAFLEHDGKRFFRTGDLGYYDEEGYFFITDRLKRMINASGFKVWPAEVEAMLYAHPAIQEACVIGAPDGYRGETVKALIVPRAGSDVSAEEIIEWARGRMAAFKVPRRIELVESLPKTATGKILWRELQERERAKSTAS
ncbi:MAG TPA: long-chain fatty acid--CoA ligase [Burkholderiales bacterium]|nr:long-chain fatty acid--CoA ligase [Burkholderiales bacterium]